jgi:hypothetical protein
VDLAFAGLASDWLPEVATLHAKANPVVRCD